MGRLFWKSFLAFWLALLLAGAGVGIAVWLHQHSEQDEGAVLLGGPRAGFAMRMAIATLHHAGPEALRELLREAETRPEGRSGGVRLMVVDEAGRDILGRPVDSEVLAEARAARMEPRSHPGPRFGAAAHQELAPDGSAWLLYVQADQPPPGRGPGLRHSPPSPWPPLAIGVLASLGFSAALAWYLARPIRNLRWAFDAVASGRLETRVAPKMGRRRDEIADLGRDFDRMAGQLQHLVTSQRRLLHDVSHELRSPLARLQAAIGLARQDPRKMEATLERIERESARLDGLVGEILTLARLEAGTAGPPAEEVDLMELVAAIADDAGFEAAASGRKLSFAGTGEVVAQVRAELLHRAVENIVRNAVKYTAPGTTVEVSAERSGDSFRVTVADRGPGVREADLAAIFDPFYRGQAGEGQAGFGLGLAIARRAVEAHGGHLTARNREGGGLVMELELPLKGEA
jgi:two-component system, OmpR family, sensor kinase